MRKYLAEALGTFVLVFFGCGTAVVCGGAAGGVVSGYLGVVAIALAFGLAIVAAAYAIGHVSGCHVNPAVSLAMLISGKLGFKDFIGYVVGQLVGAFAACGALGTIYKCSDMALPSHGLGTNGFDAASAHALTMWGALLVEVILTFVFGMTILGVTSSEKTSNIAGIIIGLTLTFVHIIGIPLTGTSVNPARSLAPAVFASITDGGFALSQVWVFIVGPFVGAALAALIFKVLFAPKAEK